MVSIRLCPGIDLQLQAIQPREQTIQIAQLLPTLLPQMRQIQIPDNLVAVLLSESFCGVDFTDVDVLLGNCD